MDTNATASSGALPGNARQTDSYVIAVMNQKGGVAKTMVALSLAAHTVAAYGRALVVDVDPQANAYDLTRAMEDPGYEVVHELDPAQLTRIRQLRDFDTILVDCPGSLEGRNVLAEVLARSTFVIIPYDHEPESVLPTIRTARRVEEVRRPLRGRRHQGGPAARRGVHHRCLEHPGKRGHPALPHCHPGVPRLA